MDPGRNCALLQVLEPAVRCLEIEEVGIKAPAGPGEEHVMFLMVGIVDGLKKLPIAGCAATVFRWAGTLTSETDCLAHWLR